MYKLFFMFIGIIVSTSAYSAEPTVLDRLKTSYCYSLFSQELQNPNIKPQVVAQMKAGIDALLPKYRETLEYAKGKLLDVAQKMEEKKAVKSGKRDLSAAESFMIFDSCKVHAGINQ